MCFNRARSDIQPVTAVLCTKVKAPGRKDWNKLVQLMKFLSNTKDEVLTMSVGKVILSIQWYIDASFEVYPDFRSHSGLLGKFVGSKGAILCESDKQKLNTNSSTTVELVATHQYLPKVLFTPLFLSEQGYDINANYIMQDNKSAILLENNGKKRSGKRTRALNIHYYMITNQISKGNLSVKYCPTDKMIADYITKGVEGIKLAKFRKEIMGFR